MPSLRREEVVTIQVLSSKQVPSRAIARQLGVAESTVRYHLRRSREGSVDGRKDKVFAAAAFADAIDAWRSTHAGERPINVHELHDHL
jgi:IS30 family transposase